MINIEKLEVGQLKSNCYIVSESTDDTALIIDPGDDADFISGKLNEKMVEPKKIIATHGHFDHNLAAFELQNAYKIPYYISENDYFLLKKMPQSAKYFLKINSVIIPKPVKFIKGGQKINIGKSYFEIIELPGHTPGGIGLYNPAEKIFFSGDTLFKNGAIGRYDFSYSDKKDLYKSIDAILSLPKDTVIYPGHGDKTSVGMEISHHI